MHAGRVVRGGTEEHSKCQQWSEQSGQNVTCAMASTTDDCIALVLVGASPGLPGGAGGALVRIWLVGSRGSAVLRPRGAGCACACTEWGQTFCPAECLCVDLALF